MRAPGKWRRRICVTGMVLAFGGLTYQPQWGYWISGATAGLLVLLGRLAFGRGWAQRLGLAPRPYAGVVFLLSLAVTLEVAFLLVPAFAARAGVKVSFSPLTDQPEWLLFTTFQTLLEEIVLGALLLFALDRAFPGRPRLLACLGGVAFSGLHVAFCAVAPLLAGTDPEWISPSVTLSLFFAGVLRNNAILSRGDIALSWGIHLGVNIPLFCTAMRTTEAGRFQAVFGDPLAVLVLAGLAAGSFRLYRTRSEPAVPGSAAPTLRSVASRHRSGDESSDFTSRMPRVIRSPKESSADPKVNGTR